MKKFRGKKNFRSYDSVDRLISAIYKRNKSDIDNAITPLVRNGKVVISSYQRFKQTVKDTMDNQSKADVLKAVDTVQRSRLFTPAAELYKENLMKAIRKDKTIAKEFRKARGWKQKFNMENLSYTGADDKTTTYQYVAGDKIIQITISKSPTAGTGASFAVGLV